MPKVLAFGTFDGFHPGHKFYLDSASAHGDLTVVIARDTTVLKVKGRPPLHDEIARQAGVQAAGYDAILGSETDKYAVLGQIRPDVICLGYDQEAFVDKLSEACKERGLEAKILRMEALEPERYKSSILNR
ncbi:MAG: adenylyltransferase/cytidyltransferase family protein [Patescibacteria group bacterium]|jgi:FAD synthetase